MIVDILFLVMLFMLLSSFVFSAIVDIYLVIKIFKDEFGCFSLDSLLTGEWDNQNLKTGEIKHYVASFEISKSLITIFLCLLGIATILDKI